MIPSILPFLINKKHRLQNDKAGNDMIKKGKSVLSRIAVGDALVYVPFSCDKSLRTYDDTEDVEALIARYKETKQKARGELEALGKQMKQKGGDQEAFVQAHEEILLDPVMEEEILSLIRRDRMYPDSAMVQVYENYIQIFSANKNEVIQERAADLRDVLSRLLRCWHGVPEKKLSDLEKPCIVIAEELFPSDTLSLDLDHIMGIITEKGGLTSHTAIIARSLDIPAILGCEGLTDLVRDGETVILDGVKEEVVLRPSEEEIRHYEKERDRIEQALEINRKYLEKEAVTKDGQKIEIRVNLASPEIRGKERIRFIDGVGLFRSEFLYLSQDQLPSEEMQYQAYKTVAQAFQEKAVVLRTLDIGGDKQVSYMELPTEENPFLGNRGIRLCLTHEDIFRTQIRAALRASAWGNLKLMFPMITSLNEFRRARDIVYEVGKELDQKHVEWNKDIQIGIMIETPAAALIADRMIDEIDFASVGTNDLTQYLCAADRMNSDVKEYYQDYHPAVFRILGMLAEVFQKAGKTLSICGELAGEYKAAPVLIGLGVKALSLSITNVPELKRRIRSITMSDAKALADEVLRMKTAQEIEQCLERFEEHIQMESTNESE